MVTAAIVIFRASLYLVAAGCIAALASGCREPAAPGSNSAGFGKPRLTAATVGEQVVLAANDYRKMPQYRNADVEYGRMLFMQCRSCHSSENDVANAAGPTLSGLLGRKVGAVAGYAYSPVMREADFFWTPSVLDAWLAEPQAFLPGNRMAWAGLRNPEHRTAVIAALLHFASAEENAVTKN